MVRRIARFLAVALYWIVTRVVIVTALLFCSLHFVLNSSSFPAMLTEVLRSATPGTIAVGTVQISPIPWKVDLLDVRISTPDGEDVIRAGSVLVSLDLAPLIRHFTDETSESLEIRFTSIRLRDFETVLAWEPSGEFRFLRAFVKPSPPQDRPPRQEEGRGGVRLSFSKIIAENGRVFLSFPQWDLSLEGLDFITSLSVAPDGHTVVRTPDLKFSSGRGRIHAGPDVVPRDVALDAGHVEGFVYDLDYIAFDRARLPMDGLDIDASACRLSFARDRPLAYEGHAALTFPSGSRLVTIATRGTVNGPLTLSVEGRGDALDPRFRLAVVSSDLSIAGQSLGAVSAAVDGGKTNGIYGFALPKVSAHPLAGAITVEEARFLPYGDTDRPGALLASARVNLDQVSLPLLLKAIGTKLPAAVPMLDRVSGSVTVAASMGPESSLDAAVSARMEGPLGPGSILAGREASIRLEAGLAVRGDMSAPEIRVDELTVRSGRDRVTMNGSMDLGTGQIDVRGSVDKDLAPLLSAFGQTGGGTAQISGLRAQGSLRSPLIRANLRVTGLAFREWSAEEISGQVRVRDREIALSGGQIKSFFGNFSFDSLGVVLRPASPALEIRNLTGTAIDMAKVPPLVPLGLRGKATLELTALGVDFRSPLSSLQAEGRLSSPSLTASGKGFSGIKAEFSVKNGHLSLPRIEAGLRGGGRVEASGTLDLVRKAIDLKLLGKEIPLPVLAGMKKDGPLQGTLSMTATASGSLADPELTADVDVDSLVYQDLRVGTLGLAVNRQSGGNLTVSADRFLPKMRLNPESGLIWENGRFTGVVVMVDINRLTPQDLFPSLKPRDFTGQFTGNLQFRMGFGPGGSLEVSLISPPDGLRASLFNREVTLTNQGRLEIAIQKDGAVTVSGLKLDDGKNAVEVCGEVLDPNGSLHLRVRGSVGLYWLRHLKEVFSSASGEIRILGSAATSKDLPPGCDASFGRDRGGFAISGEMMRPTFDGEIEMRGADLALRRYPDSLHLQPGGRIRLRTTGPGSVEARIDEDGRIRGRLGEGMFVLSGGATLSGFSLDSGEFSLSGAGLRFSSPGEFFVVGTPDVSVRFEGLAQPGAEHVTISGQMLVTDGSYHKNFDLVRKAISGVVGNRVAERRGPPLTQSVPWLANAELDLVVTGTHFGVRTQLPFGSTDLDLGLDLTVKGTVAAPELWNRLEIHPGSKVVYNLVRREFEVLRGNVDFSGDPSHPILDLSARTKIEYKGAKASASSAGSRFAPDETTESEFDANTIAVTLRVSGTYPDLDISLTSNARDLDATDLQFLLLTGMTRSEASQGTTGGMNLDMGLVTEDMTNLLSNLLLSPFVDTIRFGVNPSGGVNAEVMAHMGSRLRFQTQVLQEQGGARYSAGFDVKLTERLHLVGRLRAVDGSIDPNEVSRRYESKLQYRIPLE